jgi:tRNA pseudouridine55 synthase
VDGILLVDKAAGWTSHDVVAKMRRLAGQRRIGHTGTLDPAATGLLVLCLGRATRLVEYLTASTKTYDGVIRLGMRTATDDLEGETVETLPMPPLDQADLDAVAARFTGAIEQVPPAYSAVSVGGKRAYARARAGEDVKLQPRTVQIHGLTLHRREDGDIAAHVVCGAGTYIRSLARDIGTSLGTAGTLASLRRTRSGPFRVEDALGIKALEALAAEGRLEERLLPLDEGLARMEAAIVGEEHAGRLRHGSAVDVEPVRPYTGEVRLFDTAGAFIGIAALEADGLLRARKIMG